MVEHPLLAAGLTVLRNQETTVPEFRLTLQQASMLLFMEAARHWETSHVEVETPLRSASGAVLRRHVVLVPILRAGLGMVEGISQLLPEARIGHLGIYRDELTLRPVSYYHRLPATIATAEVLVLDPMLATGHSACAAVSLVREAGASNVRFVCLVACPEGIAQLRKEHPDVPIITAAIDSELNQFGYIVPGLGDAGDRYFGTT